MHYKYKAAAVCVYVCVCVGGGGGGIILWITSSSLKVAFSTGHCEAAAWLVRVYLLLW